MINFLLYALLAWFLYNLVFRFIIPIITTARQVRKQFRNMKQQMDDQLQQQQQVHPNQFSSRKPGARRSPGDYIDFEEIK